MNSTLKYIELKTGYHDDGPAWIGRVDFSKTGKTIYFNGHAFKGNGHGTCYDVETGKFYIKKVGRNRHWAGNGKVMIDRQVIAEYLEIKQLANLDPKNYDIIDIQPTDKQKFAAIENGLISFSQ